MAHRGIDAPGVQHVGYLSMRISSRCAHGRMPHRVEADKRTCQAHRQTQVFVQMPIGKDGRKQHAAKLYRENRRHHAHRQNHKRQEAPAAEQPVALPFKFFL